MSTIAEAEVARELGRITVSEITDEEGFDAVRGDWDRLVDRLEVPAPFHSWTWNRVWWRHFGSGAALRILIFRHDGEIAGIAPLYQRRYGSGRLGLTGLAPIGRELHSRDRDLTEQLELLFPPAERPQLLAALTRWLEGTRWSGLLLPDLQDDDVLPPWLGDRLVFRGERAPFHYRELPPTWQALVSSLGKSMRDNVKYYPGLMARHGHAYDFDVAHTPSEVTALLPFFFELHRARADVDHGTRHGDKFWSQDCRAFVREVLPLLAGQGHAKIGMLRIDGAPVAAQMWFEQRNVMFLYYSGYRPEWARYSVAFVATQEALKDAMSRGIRRVEFLRGGGQFKERWGGSSRHSTTAVFGRPPRLVKLLVDLRRSQRRLLRMLPNGQ